MKHLFIGGTGNISADCTREALRRGHDVWHINRGNRGSIDGVTTLCVDAKNADAVKAALKDETFDTVTDFIAFTKEDVERDIELFRGRTRQFVFISSASAYHKPVRSYVITESTPLHNPFWTYSQNKALCEQHLVDEYRASSFPITIVRPSHTYSDGWFPTTFGSSDYTIVARILAGKPIIVHGDGRSLWTLTHTEDFARAFVSLLGHPRAIGEAYHITSDDVLDWEEIHLTIARALGREIEIVHIPSDFIAALEPSRGAGLLGDKAFSVVFDNAKIKSLVPGWNAVIPFHEGVARSLAWREAHPETKLTDQSLEAEIERILAAWRP
ncbi:MAG: SDR family oxidoreductase [Spirochaetaceae bacterium]|nr:MAG: SDR family oxidoreductase [Spirochaetaceae bacterium]